MRQSKYRVQVETHDNVTGDFVTCNACGHKDMGTDTMNAYFLGARHQREKHNG